MSELSERIKDVIDHEPVALFMKGTPQFVMCGNSDRALRTLREAGAPVTAVDILPDPAIREELSLLDQHRLVNEALAEPLRDGTIHELRIKTKGTA